MITTTTYEVGFEVGSGIFSVNMIDAHVPEQHKEAAIREFAEKRAAHYQERVAYIRPLAACEVQERARKGMPWYALDEATKAKFGGNDDV